LTAETKYGGTVTKVKRKRVPGGGAATAKPREPKHVRTRGTANKLQSDKRSLRLRLHTQCCFVDTRDAWLGGV